MPLVGRQLCVSVFTLGEFCSRQTDEKASERARALEAAMSDRSDRKFPFVTGNRRREEGFLRARDSQVKPKASRASANEMRDNNTAADNR